MATDLANAPRGKVKLASVVQSAVPSLGIKGVRRPRRKADRSAIWVEHRQALRCD